MFYAITGLGWGTGDTPEKAVATYRRIQERNYPDMLIEGWFDQAWGFVWDAPEGTTGFYDDGFSGLHWQFDDNTTRKATAEQRVAFVGRPPQDVRDADANTHVGDMFTDAMTG